MEFVMVGFREEQGARRFTFEGIAGDRTRKQYTVSADLGMLRKYNIPVQELPLLCRRLLERESLLSETVALQFTEQLMREHQDHCTAIKREADLKKKAHKRPLPSPATGQAWRTGMGQLSANPQGDGALKK
jgi:hypothetical protein